MWKIRSFISNLIPIAVVCALIYGGWSLYQQGTFRRGVKPAIISVVSKVPYFGSRFRHYIHGGKYISKGKHVKKRGKARRSKKRHRRSRRRTR